MVLNKKGQEKQFTFTKTRLRSKVARLPKYLVASINKKIIDDGYTHRQILELIDSEVKKGNVSPENAPGKTAVAKYVKRYANEMEKIKLIEVQARALISEVGADSQALDEAVSKLAQSKLFDVLMGKVEDNRLPSLLVAAARLGQASAMRERVKLEVFKKVKSRAQQAAETVEKMAKKNGVSKTLRNKFCREILGIVDEK